MTDIIQVATTAGSYSEAEQIAAALVDQRLAACVQVAGPVRSVFRWQGKIESNEEWICTAKTRRDRYDQLAAAITRLHSYDEPEIVATPITAGSASYLQWVADETAAE